MQPVMDAAALERFMAEEFPQMAPRFRVTAVAPMRVDVAMAVTGADLRPGGTVSGPTMFALADCAYYLATLSMIGPKALAVTTSCSIDFMRKPGTAGLTAEARILKLGRVLSVGDVLIRSEGIEAPVARASLTYSIPPR
ncbi:PaaI family thioesterase [Oceanicella sp. SM1341]|uniref:PaaI family thioesterase n=1 Tax=Oceanicella sp. SM1341 TaxID=1548889 RepID=UPI000E48F3AF|nr:PaaI family thioesterase [Oceanicella sp. SM1341]